MAKQAIPMLCIPKKNGMLCTMFNLQQQNENTWKDVTPFPDQDTIHHDIVRAKFRSELDMTEAYEQTCIRPKDVCKTTFSTMLYCMDTSHLAWPVLHEPLTGD